MRVRLLSLFIALGALPFGCAAGILPEPKVDQEAMREAIAASRSKEAEPASSAAYGHFLRSRLAHFQGNSSGAIEELRLALGSDAYSPFLMTALGEEYARAADLSRAEFELSKVVERTPKYYRAHVLLGRVLYESQKSARAIAHLKIAMRLRQMEPEPYLVLAQLQIEQKLLDDAVGTIEALGAAAPGETVGFKKLGFLFFERGDLPRAESLFKKAIERDSHDFDTWIGLAQVHEGRGRIAEAEAAYAKALERDPDHQEVLLNAGRLALKQGQVTSAGAYFDRLLTLSDDPEVVAKVAFSYVSARELAAAAAVLGVAQRAGIVEARLSFYSGLIHDRMGQRLEAAQAYGEVPPTSDLAAEARMRQASDLSILGDHDRALQIFRQLRSERPEYVELYPAYAFALDRRGDTAEAEAILKQSLKTHATPELYEALSRILYRHGRGAEAIGILKTALNTRPQDEALLFVLAATYERAGEVELSIEKMRAVLAINPDNAAALNFVGYTLADCGRDYDEAEKLVTRAVQLNPDSGEFLDSLGWVYFRKGDFERAVLILERATALAPEEALIIEHLGDAYRSASKPDLAVRAYRRALEALRAASPEEASSHRAGLEQKLKLVSTEAKQ